MLCESISCLTRANRHKEEGVLHVVPGVRVDLAHNWIERKAWKEECGSKKERNEGSCVGASTVAFSFDTVPVCSAVSIPVCFWVAAA